MNPQRSVEVILSNNHLPTFSNIVLLNTCIVPFGKRLIFEDHPFLSQGCFRQFSRSRCVLRGGFFVDSCRGNGFTYLVVRF